MDYMEGEIIFEEFKRRREKRKVQQKKGLLEKGKFSPEESPDISEVPPSAGGDSVKSQGNATKEGETSME
ncbi:hypothetical protein ACRRTK_015601 [Alexandromys fortis]